MPTTSTQRRRFARRTTLIGIAAALGVAAPASAYSPGVSPQTQTIVYPGTQTPVDAWKLAGYGSATNVLVAPRWVIASGHGAPGKGVTVTLPTGQSATVIDSTSLYSGATKRFIKENGAIADISVALLDKPLPAPSTGFPQLLTDEITDDLKTALPGWVLWAGHGPNWSAPNPGVGWTRPDGTPEPGKPLLRAVGGDSGSTGLLFRTPTSTPLMPGVTDYAQAISFAGGARTGGGNDARFADVLQATATEPEETITSWLKRKFAGQPTVTAPAFTTFAASGYPFAGLPPVVPAFYGVDASSPTSVKLSWGAQKDARVPLTGYRLTVSPGARTITLPPSVLEYDVTGLTAKTNYTFTLRAINANGASGDSAVGIRKSVLTYRPRTVSAVNDLRVEPVRDRTYSGGQTRTDYCLLASWLPATIDSGDPVTGHEVTVDGVVVEKGSRNAAEGDTTKNRDAAGRYRYRACGLDPNTTHAIKVVTRSEQSVGPASTITGRTLTGAPRGTALTAPRNVRISVARTITDDGNADYCQTVAWDAPTGIDGWPIDNYAVIVYDDSDPTDRYDVVYELSEGGIDPSARSLRLCGAPPATKLRAEVTAGYQGVIAALSTEATTTSPSGAPISTPVKGPQGLTVTARKVVTPQGKVDYCARVAWNAPPAVDGFDVTGYVIRAYKLLTPVATENLPADRRSYDVCGLDAKGPYPIVMYASRSVEGTPPTAESGATMPAGAPRGTTAPAPVNPAIMVFGKNVLGKLDYCATVSWTAPGAVDGFPVNEWTVAIKDVAGQFLADGKSGIPAGTRSVEICGLSPARVYSAMVAAVYADNAMPVTANSPQVTTRAGAPRGTAISPPRTLAVSVSTESGKRCATVRWEAPTPLAGFATLGYMAFFSAAGGFLEFDADMPDTARSFKACGLPEGRVTARVSALLPDRITPSESIAFDAATGTRLP